MSGIKTDSHKNKLHAGNQVYTCTHARMHARTHTHRESGTLTWRHREKREERRIKTANMHHRCHYCIIDNVTSRKENMNETFETNTNWSLTSLTAIASSTKDKGEKIINVRICQFRKRKWSNKNRYIMKKKLLSLSTFCNVWLIHHRQINQMTDNSKKNVFPPVRST